MDKIKFAVFVAYVQRLVSTGMQLSFHEVSELEALIKECSPVPAQPPMIDMTLLHDMLASIQAGRKIYAIRAHRSLTGYGLKESKDVIEKYWPNMNVINNNV